MATNVGVLPVAGINIDYAEETEEIERFLSKYEVTRTAPRDLPVDDDDEAEEDTLADDVADLGMRDDEDALRRSKLKYMKILRRVANRQTEEVIIDLADLRKVRELCIPDYFS